ncbi:MAG: HNH endonuclease [Bdellovibrionaceae bacterium]|nr:HNH endonuclease [Pseudobdellovibrionaceae bacterium]
MRRLTAILGRSLSFPVNKHCGIFELFTLKRIFLLRVFLRQANFQLEVDHIKPLALGGEHRAENLRILCRAHNQLAAKKSGLRRLHLGHPH